MISYEFETVYPPKVVLRICDHEIYDVIVSSLVTYILSKLEYIN